MSIILVIAVFHKIEILSNFGLIMAEKMKKMNWIDSSSYVAVHNVFIIITAFKQLV